jgi:hypothetical protein
MAWHTWYNAKQREIFAMDEMMTDIKAKVVMLVSQWDRVGISDYGMGQVAAYTDVITMMQSNCVEDCIGDVVEAVDKLRAINPAYLSASDKATLSGFLAMMPQFGTMGQ